MGLFMNKDEHPGVFISGQSIDEPNQEYFKLDYFAELVKEQKEVNHSLSSSFRKLNSLYHQQKNTQANQWKEIHAQLTALHVQHDQHKKFESQATEWLTMLENNNAELKRIMKHENVLKKEIIDEITVLSQSNQEIVDQLGNYKSANEELHSQLNELVDFHKELSGQLSKQDDHQDQVLNRLETQEALMEKTLRQISQFRSILFERTNYIAESIENSYNLTSSYVYKLMTGSERPLTLYMKQKNRQNQDQVD